MALLRVEARGSAREGLVEASARARERADVDGSERLGAAWAATLAAGQPR
ncbi:MAG TPA: hypothetical protein VG963_06275 [Polyangiaceae bacterium]|nr:hypothetical protein [Polyangiaceae bacterium]